MRFLDINLQQVFADWRQAEHGSDRAIADNMWFDERISAARREVFEAAAGPAHTGKDIVNRHLDYWGECVRVDGDIPHTFLPGLDPADLGPIDKTQDIVRIEGLARPLAKLGMSFDVLEEAKRTNNTALMKKFVQTWNESNVRDWRPAFAVFHDEVKDELESPDWAHRLRDRLGLAHYNGARPTPVALMKYKVQDVIDAATAAGTSCSFAAPTALDSGPWPYFFPAPGSLPAGRTLSLYEVNDDKDLLSEILHFRIAYASHHIAALAVISAPPAPSVLSSLRNHHLLAVRLASDCYDFGEEMPG